MKRQRLARIILSLALNAILGGTALGAPILIGAQTGPQTPGMIAPGGQATYTVTVTRSGSGNLDTYLSVTNLPAGVTASFSHATLHFTGPTPSSLAATLSLSTASSVADGLYTFTLIATDGSSHNTQTGTGSLRVGIGIASVQMLSDHSTQLTCSGFPGQQYLIQATTNLLAPVWITIMTNTAGPDSIFSCVDHDAKICPCRFYRNAAL
jgi:hypothetical protein